jgi:hypothetical protein
MKKYSFLLVLLIVLPIAVKAQHVYTVSGGELIFQSARVVENGQDINTNLRFTGAFHAGEYVHVDMGDHIGMFSGIGIRNVGFITSQPGLKIKYRTYNLGIPLALKLGSFNKNIYLFGGGEYEWMFHFKQKTYVNGAKSKYSRWFSDRTPTFIPSLFAGFQFPAGLQLKFRYYLDNYLNNKYQSTEAGEYSDYTHFSKTQVWYISVSFMIRNNHIRKADDTPTDMARL